MTFQLFKDYNLTEFKKTLMENCGLKSNGVLFYTTKINIIISNFKIILPPFFIIILLISLYFLLLFRK